ncbi:MAG: hypothetical protein LBQ75_04000 [Zoogloeaceae bacterium]|jgi:hypothetical protein|nr:hypothetical protein [Zoogloeaceae bacterium]
MGTIKCGFWVTKFIITPDEFGDFLRLCDKYTIKFFLPTLENPQHSLSEVLQAYTMFYETYTAVERPKKCRRSFVYSMLIEFEKYKSGFHLVEDDVWFPYHGEWAKDKIPFLEMSFPKGHAVDYKDEKGEYFVFEDINKHRPEMYPIFEALSNHIKQFTKPFRFESFDDDKMKEKKTPVRISRQASEDFARSWLFRDNQLNMKSFVKKGA